MRRYPLMIVLVLTLFLLSIYPAGAAELQSNFVVQLQSQLGKLDDFTQGEKVALMTSLVYGLINGIDAAEMQEIWDDLTPKQMMNLTQHMKTALDKGVNCGEINTMLQNRYQKKDRYLTQLHNQLDEAISTLEANGDCDQTQDQLQDRDQEQKKDYEDPDERDHDQDPDRDRDQTGKS